MTLPNFLIIGAPKAGTTSLYEYLKQHPDVYMSPIKEPLFFSFVGENPNFLGPGDERGAINQAVTDLLKYEALFADSTNKIARGEASTMYLYLPQTPDNIKRFIPDVKLIIILRHPVDRSYSHYLYLRSLEREYLRDFGQALQQEAGRIKQHWSATWHYQQVGLYSEQIKRYFERFDREQIKIYLYEDWQQNPDQILTEICQFLEIDDHFKADMSTKYKMNQKIAIPKSKTVYNFLTQPNLIKDVLRNIIPATIRQPLAAKVYRQNQEVLPKLTPDQRQKFLPIFREDILKLQALIERDLSHWLK